jgi:hypothetical protein
MIPRDAWSLALNLLSGGSGLGAYFIPVIFQSVLFVPLLFYIARRDADLMVIAALWVSVAFMAVVLWTGTPNVSQLLYFRYLLAGALGVWLVTTGRGQVRWGKTAYRVRGSRIVDVFPETGQSVAAS